MPGGRCVAVPRQHSHTGCVAFDFSTLPDRMQRIDTSPVGNRRGKALEQLVSDTFSALPGVEVADRNVVSGSGEAEFDVLLVNERREDGVPGFDRDVLIECKSSDDPLGSRDVSHFISQATLRHLRWSIIVSLAGLTGDKTDARAAHRAIERGAEKNTWVMLFIKSELAAARSAEHLAAIVEAKRRKMLLKLRAVTLNDEELRELNPRPSGVQFTRGLAGIEQAVRQARENALALIFQAAIQRSNVEDDGALIEQAASALHALNNEVEAHRRSPAEDPMWREVHARVVSVGAAFARLLDEDLADPESQQSVSFDVRASAPQRIDADVGGELWNLLSDYRLRQVRDTEHYVRTRNAVAMISMVVEAIISIDDIDPRDIYDDDEEH